MASLKSFKSILIGNKFRLLSLSQSELDLDVFWIIILKYASALDIVPPITASHPSPEAALDHHFTTTMFGTIIFMNSVNLTTDVTRLRPSRKFHFCLVSLQKICFKDNEPVVSLLLLLFLVSSGCCLLRTLPGCQFLLIHFPIVETWTLNLNMTSKACRSSDTVLGSFVISLMSCQYGLGVILLGQPVRNGFDVNDFVCQWFH